MQSVKLYDIKNFKEHDHLSYKTHKGKSYHNCVNSFFESLLIPEFLLFDNEISVFTDII
jgi:hypothetical protein